MTNQNVGSNPKQLHTLHNEKIYNNESSVFKCPKD